MMVDEQIKPHHLAVAIRRSVKHFSGKTGPRWAKVNLDLLFVRNQDFFKDLAKDIGEWDLRLWHEEAKPVDPELITAMEATLVAYTRLRQDHEYRSTPMARLVKGETIRQIMRNSPGRLTISVMDDLQFCLDYMLKYAGESNIYRLV